MKKRRNIITIALILIACFVVVAFIIRHKKRDIPLPIKTEKIIMQNIYHTINTSGVIAIKDVYKIGSLVPGTVKHLAVTENQHVHKGDLLAEIDIGKGDTDYRYAHHLYQKAIIEYEYAHSFFLRQQKLYQSNQLSKDIYERYKRDQDAAYECMKAYESHMEKAKRELDNSKIKAPADGTIISVNTSPGAAVLNDFQNILFEIAHDTKALEARLDIDESDIGHIKINQRVSLSVNSFPYKSFKERIDSVSMAPKRLTQQGKEIKDEETGFYKALVSINNQHNLLRPGMITHAYITIDKRKKVPTLNGIAFQVSLDVIQKAAQQHNLYCRPLDKQEKKVLRKNRQGSKRFVWIYDGNGFEERAITVGLTDNSHWEIVDGISPKEMIVIDVDDQPSSAQSLSWKMPL